jgi:hypothetical protein
MGTANSKEHGGGGGSRKSGDLRPGALGLDRLPGPLTLKEYKSRLATSEGTQTLFFPQSGLQVSEKKCSRLHVRLHRVNPIGCLQVNYAFVSLRGLYPNAPDKPNQDSLCVHTHYGGDPEQAFFGIYDGHGEYGTECSQFAKDKVSSAHLCAHVILHMRFIHVLG